MNVVSRALDLARNVIANAMGYATEADFRKVADEVTQAFDAVGEYLTAPDDAEPEVPTLEDAEAAAGVTRR